MLLLDSGKTYKDKEAKTSSYYDEKLYPALKLEINGLKKFILSVGSKSKLRTALASFGKKHSTVTIIIATHAATADGDFLPINKQYLGIDNIFEMIKTNSNPKTINFFLWCCGSKAILKKLTKLNKSKALVNVLYNDSDDFYDNYVENLINRAVFTTKQMYFYEQYCPSWKKKVFAS